LDVGCGNGVFLNWIREKNIEVTGIEPSIKAWEYARSLNLNVFNLTFEKYMKMFREKNKFHIIILNCVLEHIQDPLVFLKKCKELLRDNGVIYVSVPNDFNQLQLAANRFINNPLWWVSIPAHINFF